MERSTGTARKWRRWKSSRPRLSRWRAARIAPRSTSCRRNARAMNSSRRCWPLAQRSRVDRLSSRSSAATEDTVRSEPALCAHRRFGDPAEEQHAQRKPVPERLPVHARPSSRRRARAFPASGVIRHSGTALTAATSASPYRGDADRRIARGTAASRNRCCAFRRARGTGASARPAERRTARRHMSGRVRRTCGLVSVMASSRFGWPGVPFRARRIGQPVMP